MWDKSIAFPSFEAVQKWFEENDFNHHKMCDYLDHFCKKKSELCSEFPELMMTACAKKDRQDCYKKVSTAVKKHCTQFHKSPVCGWTTTTTESTTMPTTTTTKITTTTASSTPMIVGGVIGGLALLIFITVLICFCRKSSTPVAPDVYAVEENATGKKKKKKGRKTRATTEATGTTDATTSATKKDKKKKRKNKKKKETRTTGTKTGSTGI